MGTKNLNITFDEKDFAKLEKKKKEKGLTWEDWFFWLGMNA